MYGQPVVESHIHSCEISTRLPALATTQREWYGSVGCVYIRYVLAAPAPSSTLFSPPSATCACCSASSIGEKYANHVQLYRSAARKRNEQVPTVLIRLCSWSPMMKCWYNHHAKRKRRCCHAIAITPRDARRPPGM